jgi:hypothetical protein
MTVGFEAALATPIERDRCPHLAVLLHREDELLPVLAALYALGLRRNGWLVHRVRPDEEAEHRAALEQAGLPVADLESAGRMAIAPLDPFTPAVATAEAWFRELEAALARGHAAGWYARSATGPGAAEYDAIMAHEHAWDERFRGRPVVTLCPFVVGGLEPEESAARADAVAAVHHAVLVSGGDGGFSERPQAP